MKEKIAIIGCGNLGTSILKGLISVPSIDKKKLIATRRNIKPLTDFQNTGVHITTDNIWAVKQADIILLGLKPYNILKILNDLEPHFTSKKIIVSLATGITIEQLQSKLSTPIPFFRAMPNTAADVKESITCISSQADVKEKDRLLVKQIFESIGLSIFIDESLMEAATILGACGIAYAMRFIRAMIQSGIQIGFDTVKANAIVNQTVKGAAQLLIQRGEHPEAEIDKVTTPKGCTIVGLNEMEHNGFSSSLIKGVIASFEKIEKK